MSLNDDTQPRRADVMPPEDEHDSNGPGCLAWGVVGVFSLLIAVAIVFVAAWTGFNAGVDSAQSTATAFRNANIATQCAILPEDIRSGRNALVVRRIQDLTQGGSVPTCAVPLIQLATDTIIESYGTPTAQAMTQSAVMQQASQTAQAQSSPSPAASATPPPEGTEDALVQAEPTSRYDLPGLLAEAQGSIAEANYSEAIRTLDAIIAIDPTFQTNTVNGLLFNALTARAQALYRTDGSLAEAIQLTNRAQQFGDIGDLAFERTVAQYYLDALPFLDINYPEAIRLLTQVRSLSANYRNTNTLLLEQYIAYGDALLAEGDACRALTQYEAALTIAPGNPTATQQRTVAEAQCSGIATPGATLDPNATPATPDPNLPTATNTPGIAPVGEQ